MSDHETSWLTDGRAAFLRLLPEHFERLDWGADELRVHQERSLRTVLVAAVGRSAFHRERLGGLDVERFTIDRLRELPVMTKDEMMASFDAVVTDRRLQRAGVEAHLAAVGVEPRLIDGTFLALATGGTSGRRAMYCYHRDLVPEYLATVLRGSLAALAAAFGWPLPFRPRVTLAAAPSAMHATGATSALLAGVADLTLAPATLPFDELVSRVQESEPNLLVGYTSVVARLADARRDGRLRIDPQAVVVTSEQLSADLHERITTGFGVPPANSFGSSEGLVGSAAPGRDDFTFASDTAFIEFVDRDDRPVPAGIEAHHVLVTHLTNTVQPLIRYRMDDAMTELPPDPDHGHQRALVRGRRDADVHLGDVVVHPLTIRSTLLRHAGIVEHQVVERTAGTIEVRIVADGPVDPVRVETDLSAALAAAGCAVAVRCTIVDALERDPRTGKARPVVRSLADLG